MTKQATNQPVAIGSEVTYLGDPAVIVGDHFDIIKDELQYHLKVSGANGKRKVRFVPDNQINS